VRDRGIGIAREDFERIFANFEQVHKGNTRKYGGTGLGLPISRQLVRMHGGDLWVESEIDHGTTFYFSLPGGLAHELASPTVALDEPARPSLLPRASSQELSS
jgi:signal transduction histidine kinase